jgi:hypothetical protein
MHVRGDRMSHDDVPETLRSQAACRPPSPSLPWLQANDESEDRMTSRARPWSDLGRRTHRPTGTGIRCAAAWPRGSGVS